MDLLHVLRRLPCNMINYQCNSFLIFLYESNLHGRRGRCRDHGGHGRVYHCREWSGYGGCKTGNESSDGMCNFIMKSGGMRDEPGIMFLQKKSGTPCPQCEGEGFVSCDICQGTCIVRCRAPKPMSQILRESRIKNLNEVVPATYCSCPACGTSGWQRCLNCLGDTKC